MEETQEKLRQLEQRDWWLWVTAVVIMAFLALGFFSLAVFGSPAVDSPFVWSPVWYASAGLLGLILLFGAYVVFQQNQIKSLRSELAEQVIEGNRLQTQTAELQRFTLLDPVTGLYTRQFLEQHLSAEVARSLRHGHPLNGLIVSILQFDELASRHGASGSDVLVREFTQRMRRAIRSSDLAVRLAENEFLVLLTESSIERVPHILSRLCGLEVELSGDRVPISLAAGWVAYQRGEQTDQFLERLQWEIAEDRRTGASAEAIRRAQADMRRTQDLEALGRLAGKLAHDFNNLLNLVKGYSELVLDNLGRGDPLREYVEQIHDANELANSLTRQLMAFTRNTLVAPEVLNLNALLLDMRIMLQRLMGNGIEVATQFGENVGRISGVRGQIEQVLLNLAVYARDTMPEGGRFVLETANVELDETYAHWHPGARAGSYVLLAARDNGTGVDPDTLSHIFEPFSAPKEKRKKGDGLGLAAVYGIVKQSGGYIAAESTPGRGTSFEIYWPRVAETVEAK
jgi:diguanylate cyclase (GGDEF)-like protein